MILLYSYSLGNMIEVLTDTHQLTTFTLWGKLSPKTEHFVV